MSQIGIFEGFFGPAWSDEGRRQLAGFMGEHGFGFYVYAPKADPHLRRQWRAEWPDSFLIKLRDLSGMFRRQGVRFGVGLSPFGMDSESSGDLKLLQEKVQLIREIGVDQIGVFFDDMKWEEGALASQLDTLQVVQANCPAQILFCPTFYSDDPILDRVFGQRPVNYLSEIGREVPQEIQILWTGPKVISPEIPAGHLQNVSEILRRKPFLWDNLFANDGPKQCKFLKVKAMAGRSAGAFQQSQGWAFNPMNQIGLSEIVTLAAKKVFDQAFANPEAALLAVIDQMCEPVTAQILKENKDLFLTEGLDRIADTQKALLLQKLEPLTDNTALEIKAWLQGQFTVGNECLTD